MLKALALTLFISVPVLAQQPGRAFLCDSKTVDGEPSKLKASADTGAVEIDRGQGWTPLYSDGIYCGLKLKNVNCQVAVTHNLDDVSKKYETLVGKYNCKIGGIEMADANGYLEINLSADGNGYFICGRFSKNDLLLSNCKTTSTF